MGEDVKPEMGWWSRLWGWVKTGGGEEEVEENWVRGNWHREWECLAGTFGTVVGMGNVWGLPFHIYKYGSAYLVPFLILYVLVGIPALMLHQSLGQFTSRGPGHTYRFLLPAAEGLGWTHLYSIIVTAVSYHNFNTYNLFYLLSSLDNAWHRCEEGKRRLANWANPNCLTMRESRACVRGEPDQRLWAYGTCYNNANIPQLFDRLKQCVLERVEKKGDPNGYDCGISLNFNFTNFAPSHLFAFFNVPDSEHCKAPLFKKLDECTRSAYDVYSISTENWKKGESGKYRLELGTGMGECQGYSQRVSLEQREACVHHLLTGPNNWSGDLWNSIAHYCNVTSFPETITNVSCARSVISVSESLASAQFFKFHLNAGDLGDTEAVGWDVQVIGCFCGTWLAVIITAAMGPRWIVRLFPITIAFPVLSLLALLIVPYPLSCPIWRVEKGTGVVVERAS